MNQFQKGLGLAILVFAAAAAVASAQPIEDGIRVHRAGANRAAVFMAAEPGQSIPVAVIPGRAASADDFVRAYGHEFGIQNPAAELGPKEERIDSLGFRHTSYKQAYRGVPVFSGVLRVHQNARGEFTAANGRFYSIPANLNVVPTVNRDTALRVALERIEAADEQVERFETVIVDPGWYGDSPTGPRLAYYIILTDLSAGIREAFFIDAHTSKVLDQWSLLESAKSRVVINDVTDTVVRTEGGPATGDFESDAAYDYAGDYYDYLFRAFGRDSINGAGATLNATVHLQSNSCPNAFGGPSGTFYCTGVVTDDIVAHEFTHGLTAFTADLIYQNQPGQLNESFSDVLGEIIDLLNGDAAFAGAPGGTPWPPHGTGPGTDTPNSVRTGCVGGTFMTVNSPASIAGDYAAQAASFGPQLTPTGVSGNLVIASPIRACNADLPFANGASFPGKIVLVRRGDCTFVEKVKNAQNAGAAAVIVMNNVAGGPAPMGGSDPTVTIPSVGITMADGNMLIAESASATVNITLRSNPSADVRWLVSEDSTGFGGFIRDMWMPSCAGDPDRANHPFQTCSPTDNGGVHSGSGVPNHAFAIVTDGKDFNGQSVNGIGLFKAAAVWYRALTVYLTPSSNFQDAYFALNQSAADLIGTMIKDPRDGSDYALFTAADASEVDKALLATEMNTEGLCGASLNVLDPTPPVLCEGRSPIYQDAFEAGANGWTVSNTGPAGPPTPYNWIQVSGLPLGRAGTAWFAEDPSIGNCASIDESAVHTLTSPVINLPSGLSSPSMMFTHYLETEAFYDGGNVKIRVNAGPWVTVPKSAFLHNPYNAALALSGNTNPLAGQEAWTGTSFDGPRWGTSVIDLSGFVAGGESVQFRFEFGKDGCTGEEGWYVDDFEVFTCAALATPLPEPTGATQSRFISFVVPSDTGGENTALRVKMTSLHHPSSPPPGTPDFTASEGQFRYVNSFAGSTECPDSAVFGTFYHCAKLGCEPEYRDWASELAGEVLHVTGNAVVPSSVYEVAHIAESCGSVPAADSCTDASLPLAVQTSRWGDNTRAGGGLPDGVANVLDIGAVVDKVKELPLAYIEPRLWLKTKNPNPVGEAIHVVDIGFTVDAVKNFAYPASFTIDACP
jgi:Zn-dependent metalloprotease